MMKGLLKTKSEKKLLGKHTWAERYFVQTAETLLVFDPRFKTGAPQGEINIEDITSCTIVESHGGARFDVRVGDMVLQLLAPSAGVSKLWVESLELSQRNLFEKKSKERMRVGTLADASSLSEHSVREGQLFKIGERSNTWHAWYCILFGAAFDCKLTYSHAEDQTSRGEIDLSGGGELRKLSPAELASHRAPTSFGFCFKPHGQKRNFMFAVTSEDSLLKWLLCFRSVLHAAQGDDGINEEAICAVCQDPNYPPFTLIPCGHSFCGVCTLRLQDTQGSPIGYSCPSCRVVTTTAAVPNVVLRQLLERRLPSEDQLQKKLEYETLLEEPRIIRTGSNKEENKEEADAFAKEKKGWFGNGKKNLVGTDPVDKKNTMSGNHLKIGSSMKKEAELAKAAEEIKVQEAERKAEEERQSLLKEAEEKRRLILLEMANIDVAKQSLIDPTSVREGYMYKRGAWVQNWKYRYFVISKSASTLSYYKSPQDKKPKGKVNLAYGAIIRFEPPLAPTGKDSTTAPYPHCFSIKPIGVTRTYMFVCKNEESLKAWFTAVSASTRVATLAYTSRSWTSCLN